LFVICSAFDSTKLKNQSIQLLNGQKSLKRHQNGSAKNLEEMHVKKSTAVVVVVLVVVTLLAVRIRTLWRSILYYILLAVKGAVSGVLAYYPHHGGQVQPNLDHPLYTLGWFKLIIYKACPAFLKTL